MVVIVVRYVTQCKKGCGWRGQALTDKGRDDYDRQLWLDFLCRPASLLAQLQQLQQQVARNVV